MSLLSMAYIFAALIIGGSLVLSRIVPTGRKRRCAVGVFFGLSLTIGLLFFLFLACAAAAAI